MTAVLRGVTFLSAIFVISFFTGALDAQNAIPVECGTIVENQFTANAQIQDYSISLNPLDRVTIVGSPLGTTLSFNLSLYDPVGGFLVETDRGDVSATPRLASTELSSSGVFTISAANARYQYNRTLGERSTGTDSTWQGGIGVYTLSVGCVLRDGTVINAGGAQIPNEASVQPSPTETSEIVSIGLTLFLDKDSLTLYVPPSDVPVLLADLAFQVAQGDTTQSFPLVEYSAFRGLPFNGLPTPICFRLVRSGTSSAVPGVCQNLRLILMQSVANADVFWFDPLVAEARLVTVLQNNESAGFCQTTLAGCEIEWIIETPTQTATSIPTDTPETASATPTASMTPTEAATSTPTQMPTIMDIVTHDGVSVQVVMIPCSDSYPNCIPFYISLTPLTNSAVLGANAADPNMPYLFSQYILNEKNKCQALFSDLPSEWNIGRFPTYGELERAVGYIQYNTNVREIVSSGDNYTLILIEDDKIEERVTNVPEDYRPSDPTAYRCIFTIN